MAFFQKVRQYFGFDHHDLPERPDTSEVATRSAQLTGLMKWLPNPDKILRKTGKHIEHLRELLYDDEVFTCVQYLSSALREFEWELRGEGQDDRIELTTRWLQAYDWDRLDWEIIQGRMFGYQPLEVMWKEESGLWRPNDVIGKPPEWFAFNRNNELGLRTSAGRSDIDVVQPGKFLLARNKPSYENPYGQAVLSRVFWPVTFKRGDMRFWITLAEKYGIPYAVGKHPRGASDDEVNDLLDMLAKMVQDAVAAIPDDASIELMEPGGKGVSAEIHQSLVEYLERSINKVILSNELTTSHSEHGTFAATSAQIENVSGAVVADCKRMKEQTINQLLRWVWGFNWGAPKEAPLLKCFQKEEVGKDRAERDQILVQSGVQFRKSYWAREYNIDEDDFEVVPPRNPSSEPAGGTPGGLPFQHAPTCGCAACRRGVARFAEEDEDDGQAALEEIIEAAGGDEAAEVNQVLMEDVLAEPMRLILEGDDPETVMEELAGLYPDLPTSELEERLQKLFFIADVWGRLREQQEEDNG